MKTHEGRWKEVFESSYYSSHVDICIYQSIKLINKFRWKNVKKCKVKMLNGQCNCMHNRKDKAILSIYALKCYHWTGMNPIFFLIHSGIVGRISLMCLRFFKNYRYCRSDKNFWRFDKTTQCGYDQLLKWYLAWLIRAWINIPAKGVRYGWLHFQVVVLTSYSFLIICHSYKKI